MCLVWSDLCNNRFSVLCNKSQSKKTYLIFVTIEYSVCMTITVDAEKIRSDLWHTYSVVLGCKRV